MKLLIEELKGTPLDQEFELIRPRTVKAIRFRLLKFNSPAGNLTLTLEEAGSPIAAKTITIAEIEAAINTKYNGVFPHFHGMVKFEFANEIILRPETKYVIRISGVGGYVFSEAAYIAGVKDHEFPNNTFDDSELLTDEQMPYGFEVWAYRQDQGR